MISGKALSFLIAAGVIDLGSLAQPIAPVKAKRTESESAARIAAAEAKRNRRAAKRMAERKGGE